MKVNTHSSASLFASIKANSYVYLFSIVTINFITDLPKLNGYNALYVVIDYDLTKAIVFILCIKTIDAIKTARLYHNDIYRRFRLSNRIILDRGL